jgi:Pyruvate/2-oxoacid:ferredoxin oxidoreductase gamma subunit
MVMMGALLESKTVDLTRIDLENTIRETFSDDKAQRNIEAVILGMETVQNHPALSTDEEM